jgi:hypothetical protein
VSIPHSPPTPLLGSIGVPAVPDTPAPPGVHPLPATIASVVDPARAATPRPEAAEAARSHVVSSSLELSLPQVSSPLVAGERTMRSQAGPEADGAAVGPQGYAVPSGGLPARRATSPGPRTQQSGLAPAASAPGESVLVLPAPPPPPRRHTLPGTEISVWPLVIVGIVFAAIGVAVTLWLMLGAASSSSDTASTAPTNEPGDPAANGHASAHPQRPAPATTPTTPTTPTMRGGLLTPTHVPLKPPHGR